MYVRSHIRMYASSPANNRRSQIHITLISPCVFKSARLRDGREITGNRRKFDSLISDNEVFTDQ
jgi:hypothetical protein